MSRKALLDAVAEAMRQVAVKTRKVTGQLHPIASRFTTIVSDQDGTVTFTVYGLGGRYAETFEFKLPE